ncbi:MAG: hypothetical protein HC925_01660 [Coleofasciculaceae cyanobacterium SM2_3_26]|nr:hypothetical protein [Coleofasciculaceae cyanobacterium SM2_3_26]
MTLHLSMVALYAAIAQPVRNLSYNAIPYRFVGTGAIRSVTAWCLPWHRRRGAGCCCCVRCG